MNATDGDHLIRDKLRRRKHNNTRFHREEEEHRLIAEGEGKLVIVIDEDMLISYLQDQGRRGRLPLKNASKFHLLKKNLLKLPYSWMRVAENGLLVRGEAGRKPHQHLFFFINKK